MLTKVPRKIISSVTATQAAIARTSPTAPAIPRDDPDDAPPTALVRVSCRSESSVFEITKISAAGMQPSATAVCVRLRLFRQSAVRTNGRPSLERVTKARRVQMPKPRVGRGLDGAPGGRALSQKVSAMGVTESRRATNSASTPSWGSTVILELVRRAADNACQRDLPRNLSSNFAMFGSIDRFPARPNNLMTIPMIR